MEEAEDMKHRRLAALEKFALNHPDHPMVARLMQQVRGEEFAEPEAEWKLGESKEGSWYHWLRGQQLRPASKGKRQFSGKQGSINKWGTASSLELIAELEKFQETLIELSTRGIKVTSDSRWAVIAKNLPNRHGLEPAKFARSCKQHFLNLGRLYREQKNLKGGECLDAQVRQALEDYFLLGGENVALPPPRKGLGVNDNVEREGYKKNAINFKISTMFTDKIERGEKSARMVAPAGKTIVGGPSSTVCEVIVKGSGFRINPNTKRMKRWESPVFKFSEGKGYGVDEANEDPYEREEPGNPHRQDQLVNPTMDSAILKRWESPVFKSSDGKGKRPAKENEDTYERGEPGNPHRRDQRVNPTGGGFLKRWEPPVLFKCLDGKGSGLELEANEDPYAQEEVGNPHRQDQRQCVIPTTDSSARMKGWDTASSVRLLETMEKVGAKAVNGWETVASLLPNHDELDPQKFARSCKEHYLDLLRTHKGKWKENSGHKQLADEVNAQLQKLLRSSTENPKNKEVSSVERREITSVRVAVKLPVSPPVIENLDEEERGITKTCGLSKELDSGAMAKNRKEACLVKATSRQPNHLPVRIYSENNDNNSMDLDSDNESEEKWNEYRRMIKKRPRDEDEEWEPENPITIGKTYIDLLESSIHANTSLDPKGLDQIVDKFSVSCEDDPEHLRPSNKGMEEESKRGGAIQQRVLQNKGDESKNNTAKNFEIRGSKEKVSNNAKLKKLWQLEGYKFVEDGDIWEGKNPKGLTSRSKHKNVAQQHQSQAPMIGST